MKIRLSLMLIKGKKRRMIGLIGLEPRNIISITEEERRQQKVTFVTYIDHRRIHRCPVLESKEEIEEKIKLSRRIENYRKI